MQLSFKNKYFQLEKTLLCLNAICMFKHETQQINHRSSWIKRLNKHEAVAKAKKIFSQASEQCAQLSNACNDLTFASFYDRLSSQPQLDLSLSQII